MSLHGRVLVFFIKQLSAREILEDFLSRNYGPRGSVIILFIMRTVFITRTILLLPKFTSIHDESLVRWMRWLTAGMEPSAKLWPSSQALFTKCWKRCVHQLNYTAMGITPGSLRPGGATYHFLQHQSIAVRRIAGRWRAESSFEHYIQLVMSHLCLTQLSDADHAFATALAHSSEPQWQQPPNQPWSCLFSSARRCQALEVARKRRSTQKSFGTWQVAPIAFPNSTSRQ